MHKTEIERLSNDRKETQHHIYRLKKKGKNDLAYKVAKKNDFLNAHIAEMQSTQM